MILFLCIFLFACLYTAMGILVSGLLYTNRVEMTPNEKKIIFCMVVLLWPLVLFMILYSTAKGWLD